MEYQEDTYDVGLFIGDISEELEIAINLGVKKLDRNCSFIVYRESDNTGSWLECPLHYQDKSYKKTIQPIIELLCEQRTNQQEK